MTCTGEREIDAVSGRLLDNLGELAYVQTVFGNLTQGCFNSPVILE